MKDPMEIVSKLTDEELAQAVHDIEQMVNGNLLKSDASDVYQRVEKEISEHCEKPNIFPFMMIPNHSDLNTEAQVDTALLYEAGTRFSKSLRVSKKRINHK